MTEYSLVSHTDHMHTLFKQTVKEDRSENQLYLTKKVL